MKRPRMFYLVAAWCFIGMFLQWSGLNRLVEASHVGGEPVPTIWFILPLVAFGFLVWQMVGLVQLKRFHRWFAVVFLSWWTVALLWNTAALIGRPTTRLLPALVLVTILVALNSTGAWYLSRRSFREFAVRFVAERADARRSDLMREAARKRMRMEIRRMRS